MCCSPAVSAPRALWPPLLVLLALLVFAPGAESAQLERLSLRGLAKRAEAIVTGRAGGRHAEVDRLGRPWTLVDVQIARLVHDRSGSLRASNRIEVALLGGTVGRRAMRVPGEAHLPEGGRFLLFLWRDGHGRWRPLGMEQGVLPLHERADGSVWVGTSHLRSSPSNGAPALRADRPTPPPASARAPRPLEPLLAQLRRWAQEPTR